MAKRRNGLEPRPRRATEYRYRLLSQPRFVAAPPVGALPGRGQIGQGGDAAVDSSVPHSVYMRLEARLDTMPVVEQAKGIVMARDGCGPEEAFDLLRRASQRANLKVHVLAALLVEQASGNPVAKMPGSEPGGPARPAMVPSEIMIEAGQYRDRRTAGTAGGGLTMEAQAPGPGRDSDQRLSHPRPGTVVVTLPGELTHGNADQVKLTLAAAFGAGVGTVVADGTPTVFCDSAGVRELVVAHKHATAAGATFRVVVPHHYLRDRLVRTGLASYLPVYPTLAEALPAAQGAEAPSERRDAEDGPARR